MAATHASSGPDGVRHFHLYSGMIAKPILGNQKASGGTTGDADQLQRKNPEYLRGSCVRVGATEAEQVGQLYEFSIIQLHNVSQLERADKDTSIVEWRAQVDIENTERFLACGPEESVHSGA